MVEVWIVMKIIILLLIVFTVLIFFNLLNKRKENSQNNKSKKEDKIFGHDELKKTKKYSNLLNYFIRFHVYPDTKIVKTTAGNSILISLPSGEGWSLLSETSNFEIEKNIFFGNKSRIINNESISMSGEITGEIVSIKWVIERVN